ncbi:hypothetical protein S83_001090, partial [Arachis hypogaea]
EKPGHDFALNATYDDVNASSYDALVILGGCAPEYLALNKSVIALVKCIPYRYKIEEKTWLGNLNEFEVL